MPTPTVIEGDLDQTTEFRQRPDGRPLKIVNGGRFKIVLPGAVSKTTRAGGEEEGSLAQFLGEKGIHLTPNGELEVEDSARNEQERSYLETLGQNLIEGPHRRGTKAADQALGLLLQVMGENGIGLTPEGKGDPRIVKAARNLGWLINPNPFPAATLPIEAVPAYGESAPKTKPPLAGSVSGLKERQLSEASYWKVNRITDNPREFETLLTQAGITQDLTDMLAQNDPLGTAGGNFARNASPRFARNESPHGR